MKHPILTIRRATLASMFWMSLAAAAFSADEPATLPKVGLRVAIQSQVLQNGLDLRRSEVERQCAVQWATLASQYFGFLDWRANPGPSEKLAACVTARIVDAGGGPAVLPAIHVTYWVGCDEATARELTQVNAWLRTTLPAVALEPELDRQPLAAAYPPNALPPVHDKAAITRRIGGVIRQHFEHEKLRELWHERFNKGIAITDKLDVHAQLVVVPVSVFLLKAADDSEFRVNLQAPVGDGTLHLVKRGADPRHFAQCVVRELVFPSPNQPGVAEVVENATVLKVFMWVYKPELPAPSEDGLITDVL